MIEGNKMFNNYDQSSSGINIKIDMGLDWTEGRERYKENFVRLYGSTLQYTAQGTIKPLSVTELLLIDEAQDLSVLYEYVGLKEDYWCIEEAACLYKDLEEFGEVLEKLNIKFTRNYTKIVSNLSYQEYAVVLVPIKEYKSIPADKKEHFKRHLELLLWTQPIYMRGYINDYPIDSISEYEYDKEYFISHILNQFGYLDKSLLRAELECILPEDKNDIEYK
jgi:hypothetical protein